MRALGIASLIFCCGITTGCVLSKLTMHDGDAGVGGNGNEGGSTSSGVSTGGNQLTVGGMSSQGEGGGSVGAGGTSADSSGFGESQKIEPEARSGPGRSQKVYRFVLSEKELDPPRQSRLVILLAQFRQFDEMQFQGIGEFKVVVNLLHPKCAVETRGRQQACIEKDNDGVDRDARFVVGAS